MHTISHEWLPSEVPFTPYYFVRRTLHPRSLPQSHGLQVHVRAMLLHAEKTLFIRSVNSRLRVLGGGGGGITYLEGEFDAFLNIFHDFGVFLGEGGFWGVNPLRR